MAAAETIGIQLPGLRAASQQNSDVAARVGQIEELTALNRRIADLEKSIAALRSTDLTDEITAGANANTAALQEAIKALREMQTEAANLRSQAASHFR